MFFLPLAIAVLASGMRVWIGPRQPLVLIEADTGYLSYRVQREDLSSVALQGAEVTDVAALCDEGLDEAGRVAAIIRPPMGALVEYRWLPGMILIRLSSSGDAKTMVENFDGSQCRVDTDLTFLVPAEALSRIGPLPVLGAGQIGMELGVPTLGRLPGHCTSPGLEDRRCIHNGRREIPVDPASSSALYAATARLYGRTSVSGGQLYPISGGDFVIPGGSRLEASDGTAPFIGSVTLDRDAQALRVQVSTEAESLRLFRAGQDQQAETLATGSVARTFADPSLGALLLFAAILAFLVQFAINLRDILRDGWGRK